VKRSAFASGAGAALPSAAASPILPNDHQGAARLKDALRLQGDWATVRIGRHLHGDAIFAPLDHPHGLSGDPNQR
jgi:hypothetical protein